MINNFPIQTNPNKMSENEIEIIDLDSSSNSIEILQPPEEIEMIDLVSEEEQEPLVFQHVPHILPPMRLLAREYEYLNRAPASPEDGGFIYSSEDMESNYSDFSQYSHASLFHNRSIDFMPSPVPSTTYTIEYTESETESDFEVELVQPIARPAPGPVDEDARVELDSDVDHEE